MRVCFGIHEFGQGCVCRDYTREIADGIDKD